MKNVLVDSSVWIDYFKGGKNIDVNLFEKLADNNQIVTNQLILAELIPSLTLKNETEVIDILKTIDCISLAINWVEIIRFQSINLKNGINKVGIPDLIIIQNVLQNDLTLFSLDKHLYLMEKFHKYKMT